MPYIQEERRQWPVTVHLIIINVIVYLGIMINEQFMVSNFALFYPSVRWFKIWQPITYMFMHGGFWHLFFNMYSLLMFGMVVERQLGTKRFLIFYFVTGLGAALLHTGVQALEVQHYIASGTAESQIAYTNLLRTPVLGASGAIYGILVAFAMLYPDARMTLIFPPITLDAKWWVTIFIVIELVTGITGTQMGVAHFAHLGGALFGFLLILYWRKKGQLWRG